MADKETRLDPENVELLKGTARYAFEGIKSGEVEPLAGLQEISNVIKEINKGRADKDKVGNEILGEKSRHEMDAELKEVTKKLQKNILKLLRNFFLKLMLCLLVRMVKLRKLEGQQKLLKIDLKQQENS